MQDNDFNIFQAKRHDSRVHGWFRGWCHPQCHVQCHPLSLLQMSPFMFPQNIMFNVTPNAFPKYHPQCHVQCHPLCDPLCNAIKLKISRGPKIPPDISLMSHLKLLPSTPWMRQVKPLFVISILPQYHLNQLSGSLHLSPIPCLHLWYPPKTNIYRSAHTHTNVMIWPCKGFAKQSSQILLSFSASYKDLSLTLNAVFGKPRVEGCLSFPPPVAAVDHLCLFVSFHIGDRWDKAWLSGKINWFSKQVQTLY